MRREAPSFPAILPHPYRKVWNQTNPEGKPLCTLLWIGEWKPDTTHKYWIRNWNDFICTDTELQSKKWNRGCISLCNLNQAVPVFSFFKLISALVLWYCSQRTKWPCLPSVMFTNAYHLELPLVFTFYFHALETCVLASFSEVYVRQLRKYGCSDLRTLN